MIFLFIVMHFSACFKHFKSTLPTFVLDTHSAHHARQGLSAMRELG